MPKSKDRTEEGRMLQLQAMNRSQTIAIRNRARSFSSFYAAEDSDSDDSVNSNLNRANSLMEFPTGKKGMDFIPENLRSSDGMLRKSFRRKVKRLADREERAKHREDVIEEPIEVARGATIGRRQRETKLTKLVDYAFKNHNSKELDSTLSVSSQLKVLKSARMKLFVARTAIDLQPKLIEKTMNQLNAAKLSQHSPGAVSLHVSSMINMDDDQYNSAVTDAVTEQRMTELVELARNDIELIQHLLYSPRYDSKWKDKYTKLFLSRSNGKKEKKPKNKQGWVLPLKRVCETSGLSYHFFTDNPHVTLQEARARVLRLRMNIKEQSSSYLAASDETAVSNPVLADFLCNHLEPSAMEERITNYARYVLADRDHVKVAGKFYNNIKLGKRMFGPSRKQKVESSIIGGMERRFEILDNQVNHIPFTHDISDQHKDKCRNEYVHCKDSTRVVLNYASEEAGHDFIHANRITGGPLFNTFILTQAPMDNTIGDFWRMVWQERIPYIFMLTSRKEKERCADYWPKKVGGSMNVYGLYVETVAVNLSSDPLFRITSIRITGPDGERMNVEHWQGNMNNSSNVLSPLNLLRKARNCQKPVLVHDCLGISRAACLVSLEVAICLIMRGPDYPHLVQKSIQFVRSQRPFAVETPMQYIFIHRCLQMYFQDKGCSIVEMKDDYARWLKERANRMFIDDIDAPVPGYRLLSPKVDPDLLRQVRRPRRPNYRREAPDCVGEWPATDEETVDNVHRNLFN